VIHAMLAHWHDGADGDILAQGSDILFVFLDYESL
jgi:hypothetical protein